MKEQKTLNDLINYYENKCEDLRYISFPCDQDDFIKHRTQQKEDEEILSQLKQLKEDNPYQKMWEELKQQPTLYRTSYLDRLGLVEDKFLNELIEELENKYLGVDNNE